MAEEKDSKSVALPSCNQNFFRVLRTNKVVHKWHKKKFVLPKTNMSKTSANSVFLLTSSNKRRMWSLLTV